MNAEIMGIISGVASSVVTAAVGYGILSNKVDRLEKDMEKLVSLELFQATISPLKDDITEIKAGLKELLLRTLKT
jgi:hypothetical protein